jgi:hypothetical protein
MMMSIKHFKKILVLTLILCKIKIMINYKVKINMLNTTPTLQEEERKI